MRSAADLSEFNRRLFSDRVFEARESRLRKAFALLDEEAVRGPALDVAAGSGIASAAMAASGWRVTALDISEDLLAQVRERGIEDVRVHDLASGALPFAEGSFRAVFAGEILEHLVDTGGFLGEVRRVLQPGGVLILTTPNLASLENRLRLLLGLYPLWVDHELAGEGHVRAYTAPVLRRQLRRVGLRPERVRGNWVPLLPQRLLNDVIWPALALTGDWFPRLSQGLIVKARRA
jgi:SAM-dependent methyltransferase